MARELPAAAKKMGRGLTVEVFSLPGRHWKWRMHAAALTLVARMEEAGLFEAGVDAYIVTDMLDVGQFRSALPPAERSKPVVLYFHENQPDVSSPSRKAGRGVGSALCLHECHGGHCWPMQCGSTRCITGTCSWKLCRHSCRHFLLHDRRIRQR